MKLVIQRVQQARVEVNQRTVGSIGKGILVFVGVTHSDTVAEALWLAQKCVHLRLFSDSQGKINRSLMEENGEALLVSQFTLYADCMEGRRPSFIQAAAPEKAQELYQKFVDAVKAQGVLTQTGIFGAPNLIFFPATAARICRGARRRSA